MILFQWLAIPLLCLAALWDMAMLLRTSGQRRYRLLRMAIWASRLC